MDEKEIMQDQKPGKNKSIFVLIIIITILLIIGCVFFISYKTKSNNNDDISKEHEKISKDEEEIEEDVPQKPSNEYSLNLSKENESIDIDKLHLEFNGFIQNEENSQYTYVLNIKYDGKDIDSSFFQDKDNFRIWSNNMAASFDIYIIDNVYVLVSNLAAQCFTQRIMIFNTNGEVLKTFSNADIVINGSSIKIRTSDNGLCMMGKGWEEHVKESHYVVDGLYLNQV